jgi:hypothetical protein
MAKGNTPISIPVLLAQIAEPHVPRHRKIVAAVSADALTLYSIPYWAATNAGSVRSSMNVAKQ